MDLLSDILMRVSLKGSLYFRTSFTSPWGIEVPRYQNVARFHFVHRGCCVVRVEGASAPVLLNKGDLVIIPRGASHRLYGGAANEDRVLPLDRVLELSGYTGTGALIYGGGEDDSETQLICGHFSFDPLARHPLVERLPACIHLRNYGEIAGKWMETSLLMIGSEAGGVQIGGDLIALKMSEIIFAQALRAYLVTDGAGLPGLAGFSDPHIARALTGLHHAPNRNWTVAGLAREAGLSRTLFAARFAQLMDMTPISYLTAWRMQVARHALRHARLSVADVAERVGYASEAGFARVFKKDTGLSPAAFRKAP